MKRKIHFVFAGKKVKKRDESNCGKPKKKKKKKEEKKRKKESYDVFLISHGPNYFISYMKALELNAFLQTLTAGKVHAVSYQNRGGRE